MMNMENAKAQTFGVEIEMNNITRRDAAKLAAEFFGTGRYEDGEYCGKPLDRCIGSRNGGNYLLFHELAPEVLEENQSLC